MSSYTPFNFIEYPMDAVFLVIVWRLRYKLSLRDVMEMFSASSVLTEPLAEIIYCGRRSHAVHNK
jgi:hypothetical protein